MTNKLTTQNQTSVTQAIAPAVSLWADSTTDQDSARRLDLFRDKTNAVLDFFRFTQKAPGEVTSLDVKLWQAELEAQELAASTIYAKISKVSSFYEWAIENGQTKHNPVNAGRPKAPKAYQNESAQGLTDEEAQALLSTVKAKALAGVVGKRDYALLLLYFLTGKRRNEIIKLRKKDIRINGNLIIRFKLKGGDRRKCDVDHKDAKDALLAYIEASGRNWSDMQPDDPVWLVHDRSGLHTGKRLSSHGFVANVKRYAKKAGLEHFHLHQTRHTAAGWADDINEAQNLLDHKHQSTTRIYKQTIDVKKDTFSGKAASRLGL